MLTIQLDMLQTAALAMILFLIGRFTVSHVAFFQRCCIPAPVIGGLIFAILHLVAYQTGILTFTFDESVLPLGTALLARCVVLFLLRNSK